MKTLALIFALAAAASAQDLPTDGVGTEIKHHSDR